MPTIKTEDLTGAALDWAVAVAEGKDHSTDKDWGNALVNDLGRCSIAHRNWNGAKYFEPSKNWGHGGPIVERENIGLLPPTHRVHRNGGNSPGWGPSGIWSATTWHAGVNGKRSVAWHETDPLIAAMRCYVESKLGESIDVPQHVVDGAQRAAQAAQQGGDKQ